MSNYEIQNDGTIVRYDKKEDADMVEKTTSTQKGTTAKKTATTETTVKKSGRTRKTAAKNPSSSKKSIPVDDVKNNAPANNNSANEEQREMLQRLLNLQSEMAGNVDKLSKQLDDIKVEVNGMKDRIKNMDTNKASTGTHTAVNDDDHNNRDHRRDSFRDFCDRMKRPLTYPRWMWLLLAILALLLLLALAVSTADRMPERVTTTVTAQRGSVAVNGDVTIHLYQDRYTTDGADAQISMSRPLISINYMGEEPEADESIKIDTADTDVIVRPEAVEVKGE